VKQRIEDQKTNLFMIMGSEGEFETHYDSLNESQVLLETMLGQINDKKLAFLLRMKEDPKWWFNLERSSE
jgi:hypothetical protein